MRYMSGNATTAAASTPPYHVITNLMPVLGEEYAQGALGAKDQKYEITYYRRRQHHWQSQYDIQYALYGAGQPCHIMSCKNARKKHQHAALLRLF